MNSRTTMWTLARSAWRLVVRRSGHADDRPAARGCGTVGKRNPAWQAPASTEVKAPIPKPASTRSVQTSSDGNYLLVGLPPGSYRVTGGGSEYVVTLGIASTANLDFDTAQPQPWAK